MKNELIRQILMFSKLTFYGFVLQCFFVSILLANKGNAQITESIKDISLTVSFNNEDLLSVFSKIEARTNLKFAFNEVDIDKKIKVDHKYIETSLYTILLQLSEESDLKFKQINNTINVDKVTKNKHVKIDIILQDRTITGRVTSDDAEEGLPGVNVIVKGTSTGSVTDIDGRYSINVPDNDAILVFSSVGFVKEEVEVGNQTVINMHLMPDITALEEIVVIGYGTQRREDVTTAVEKVKPEKFVPGAVRDVGELLKGKVAGLTFSTSSGDPGADSEVLLRGITSIQGSTSPLVLIDGYPGGLNAISPNDIESIEVLKDASAAAIYGTRGKNGVILITTKKAKGAMDPVLEYSGYVAMERFQKTADFLDASDVEGLVNEGAIDPSYDLGGDTDWLSEITRKPVNHFHNLSMRGGTERTRYVANASYQMAEGIFLNSENEEFKVRLDLDQYFLDNKLKANVNVLHGRQKYGGFNGGIYRQALIRNPTDDIMDSDGEWVEHLDQFQYENPVALLKEQVTDDNSQWTWFTGSLSYYPIDGMELKIVGSQHNWGRDIGTYQTKDHVSSKRGRNGWAYVSEEERVENFFDLTADYSKMFGRHRISGLMGYSYIDNYYSRHTITNYDFPTDEFTYHGIEHGRALLDGRSGAGLNLEKDNNNANWPSEWKLIGFFGRIGYGFNNKYNVLASVRYEGSSRFGEDHKWGLFPAVSAGWTLSNEAFLKGADFVSNLKIRGGYGRTGSISSDPYESLTRFAYSSTQFYFNGTDWVGILSPVGSNPNPNLGWETNIEYNVGLDFGLLNKVIYGSIDYYDRTLEDLVYNYPVPVPPNLVGETKANGASMVNRGIEIALNIEPFKERKFEWTTNLNYSRNSNELKSLSGDEFQLENDFIYRGYTGDPIQLSTHKIQEGEPVGSFYGYKSVGLEEDPDNPGWGNWLIEGADGEVKPLNEATDDDRQILGNGLPTWYAAWNNYFKYGNFDLNITMRGAFDYQILNFQRMFYENPTIVYNRLESAFDKIDGLYVNSPQSYVSHYIEDGDYWKIDNVTLGYNFPVNNINAINSARIYLSGTNLAVITSYKGLDPEVTRLGDDGLSPGNDNRDKYPTVRTFTLGVNLTF